MIEGKSIIAIIPARGGSKRLPNKNILDLAGKPLIAWTIEAAKSSCYVDEVLVSTDSDKIADIVKYYGSKVLMRPDHLASDVAASVDVIFHAVNSQELAYDYILLLQPTSPLRKCNHINESIELLVKNNADAVISVCETDHSPLWANTLPEDGNMDSFINDSVKNKRSQDLPVFYKLNGAIYLIKTEELNRNKNFFLKKNTYAYIMDREASIDIDTSLELELADLIMKK